MTSLLSHPLPDSSSSASDPAEAPEEYEYEYDLGGTESGGDSSYEYDLRDSNCCSDDCCSDASLATSADWSVSTGDYSSEGCASASDSGESPAPAPYMIERWRPGMAVGYKAVALRKRASAGRRGVQLDGIYAVLTLAISALASPVSELGNVGLDVFRPGVKYRTRGPAFVWGVRLVGSPPRVAKMAARLWRRGPAAFEYVSRYDPSFTYKYGEAAEARGPGADGEGPRIVSGCGTGIHFFPDIKSAVAYGRVPAARRLRPRRLHLKNVEWAPYTTLVSAPYELGPVDDR